MKKILFILVVAATFVSCKKENDNDNLCPSVSEKAVPPSVSNALREKYPTAIVEKWFNKDNKGYCALFTYNGKETKVLFDNNGIFQKQEIEGIDEKDDIDKDGCECDIENDDDD